MPSTRRTVRVPGTPPRTSVPLPIMKVCYILGAPGSGKGTLCAKIKDTPGLQHLSVGDYLRELCQPDADVSILKAARLSQEELVDLMQKRALVPPAAIVAILRRVLGRLQEGGCKVVLLDGFPRDIVSAELFDKEASEYAPKLVIHLQCDKDICKARFLKRARSEDDTVEVFDRRYGEYQDKNEDILARYQSIVRTVDTNGPLNELELDVLSITT